jgi:hypothetical protein
MRKAFPQKMLADLGLDASAPAASSSKERGRRRRATVVQAIPPVRVKAASELDALARTLQPEPDELDLGW